MIHYHHHTISLILTVLPIMNIHIVRLKNLAYQLQKLFNINLKRKMDSKIFSKPNCSTKDAFDFNNLEQNIVWFDGEMTGLNPDKQTFIEAAIVITNGHLKVLAESPNIIIYQPDEVLENMEDWPKEHLALNGLIESVKKSKISMEQADQLLYDFIKPFTVKGKCPLAGNSIYMDRMFIKKYMPKLESHLSYRLIDVSTIKELIKYWKPETVNNIPKKTCKHRALDDIRESIQELQFYKNYVFK